MCEILISKPFINLTLGGDNGEDKNEFEKWNSVYL